MLVEREGGSESARKMVNEATSRLNSGDIMAIFPEGTRNKTKYKDLLPFKKGAFILAKHTKVSLLPVAIYNSGNLWPSGTYLPKQGTIKISIGKPLTLNADETLSAITQRAYETMEKLYSSLSESNTQKNKEELTSPKE
jgi:1-acyl-sn-glycerol-3-phosphate acyltransferase